MSRLAALFGLSFLAFLPLTHAAPVPRGEVLDPAQPLSWQFDAALIGAGAGALPARRLFIDPRGFITLDGQWVDDAAPVPLAAFPGSGIIAPLWGSFAGGACAPGERAAVVERMVDRAARRVTVSWFREAPAACGLGAAGEATFGVVLEGSEGGGLVVTFLYERLPPAEPAAQPRAGVVLGRQVVELLPDWPEPPSDRAKALLTGGSERVVEVDPLDPERRVQRIPTPGQWVIELDGDGVLVGDDDGDGIRSGDNCEEQLNPMQHNEDADELGDICDDNDDNDHLLDIDDNCPLVHNNDQLDFDRDGHGDACDPDDDGDGVLDGDDLCPFTRDPAQLDLDGDGLGDACDADVDGDGLFPWGVFPATAARFDRCPFIHELRPADRDGDGLGDPCDLAPKAFCRGAACEAQKDADGDGVIDALDRCPTIYELFQSDRDRDGRGDACDGDVDGDGVLDLYDDCVGCIRPVLPRIIAPIPRPEGE